jgi:hypothetical protein
MGGGREARHRGGDEAGADLAGAGDLAGHAGVDRGDEPGAHDAGDVDAGGGAAELEDGDLPGGVLGEGDLIHLERGCQRVGDLPADKADDRRRGGHRRTADAGGLGDRGVADVGVGIGGDMRFRGSGPGEVRTFGPLSAGKAASPCTKMDHPRER